MRNHDVTPMELKQYKHTSTPREPYTNTFNVLQTKDDELTSEPLGLLTVERWDLSYLQAI